MEAKEAIEVLTDKNTSIGTLKCDDTAWRKLKPAIDAAVEALKKQIPQKPIISGALNDWYICPCCGDEICKKYEYDNRYVNCHWCGQTLDWEENHKD